MTFSVKGEEADLWQVWDSNKLRLSDQSEQNTHIVVVRTKYILNLLIVTCLLYNNEYSQKTKVS